MHHEAQRLIGQKTARCRELAAQIAMLQAELAAVVRELDELGGHLGGLTTAQHLAAECQLLPAEARRVVRLADRLDDTPGIARAFAEGRLSEGTVGALLTVATAENEARLLETAEQANAGQLQRVVRTFRQVRAVDAPPADERVTFSLRDDGMWHGSARLRPEHGALVEAALRAAREAGPTAPDVHLDDAEGLVRLAESYLGGVAGAAAVLPERFLTIVHVDADGATHLHNGGALDRPTAEAAWCASWGVAVLRERGRPVRATVPRRSVTPAQRSALLARDGGCRLCGATRHLHPHHIVPHAGGGPTSLDNLVLLCGTDRRRLHRHRWRITGHPEGRLRFWRADGREIPLRGVRAAPVSGAAPVPEPPAEVVAARGPHNGDRLDRYALDVLVSHLLEPDDRDSPPGGRAPDDG
jgi:hypothetical protein